MRIEKLSDRAPLDHGIEPSDIRRMQPVPEIVLERHTAPAERLSVAALADYHTIKSRLFHDTIIRIKARVAHTQHLPLLY